MLNLGRELLTLPGVRYFLFGLALALFGGAANAQEAFLLMTVNRISAASADSTGEAPANEVSRQLFPLGHRSHAYQAVLPGAEGQQVVVRFIGVLLPSGLCAVANYQALGLAAPRPGKPFGEGSTIEDNRFGFSLQLGGQVSRSISAQGDHGPINYRLVFTAIKVYGALPSEEKRRSGGWF